MVQAKLVGYGALPGKDHAATGDAYVRVVRGAAKGASSSAGNAGSIEALERTRAIAARRTTHLRYLAAQAYREAEILRLLRIFGDSWLSDLYGRYVQVCAEKGWPVVTSRRFLSYVDIMCLKGRVWKDVVSLGRGGVRARISIVTVHQSTDSVDSRDETTSRPTDRPPTRLLSYDSVSRMTLQSTPKGGTP